MQDVNSKRLKELAKRKKNSVLPPQMLGNARVLRHLWVLFDHKGSNKGLPESKIEFHIPFFYEDMLQINYNLSELKKFELNRMSVRASKAIGPSMWILPHYDFKTQNAGLDIQHEMYV